MKILVLCDQGENRSPTLAHQLKYLGHDVLTAGLARNSADTLHILRHWADKIIITEAGQLPVGGKVELWDIGPDIYPRPFNKKLLKIVRLLIELHRAEL